MKYFTKAPGVGGRLRQRIEDFKVEEMPSEMPPGEEFTLFWMEKFNEDTNRAIAVLAKYLHVSARRLSVAGTKDKRAVTKQRVSAWKIEPEQLEKIDLKYIKLSGFEKTSKRLMLGDLEGNKFIIKIRDIALEKKELEKRMKSTMAEIRKGIPNVFGVQRFGEVRPITHLVGKEILKNSVEEAAKIYLAVAYPGEPDDAKEARNFLKDNWNETGFREALNKFPQRLRYEKSMLYYLADNPDDFAGAIRRFPKNLMKMFVNAYQSYLFNEVVSDYIKNGRKKVPLVGFDTKLGKNDAMMKDLLKKEGIKLDDFMSESMPELRCTGSDRETILVANDLKLEGIEDDEFNPGKLCATVSFSLNPGSYATVILKEIMKD